MRKGWKYLLILVVVLMVCYTIYRLPLVNAQQPTIYWGSRGSEVKVLQWKLNEWGYYDGTVDGIFGYSTALAVRDFQRKNRLRVDGIVGPETWGALGYRGTATATVGGRRQMAAGAVDRGDDLTMLARLIHAEAGAEPYEGQVAVGAVLLNRIESPKFPNSLSGVIFQPLAFESVANGHYYSPHTNENVKAARSALNGWDPTYGSLFFWNPSKPVNPWIWSRRIVRRIGGHVFAH